MTEKTIYVVRNEADGQPWAICESRAEAEAFCKEHDYCPLLEICEY